MKRLSNEDTIVLQQARKRKPDTSIEALKALYQPKKVAVSATEASSASSAAPPLLDVAPVEPTVAEPLAATMADGAPPAATTVAASTVMASTLVSPPVSMDTMASSTTAPIAHDEVVVVETVELLIEEPDGSLTKVPVTGTIVDQQAAAEATIIHEAAGATLVDTSNDLEEEVEEGEGQEEEDDQEQCHSQSHESLPISPNATAKPPPPSLPLASLVAAMNGINETLKVLAGECKTSQSYLRRICHELEDLAHEKKKSLAGHREEPSRAKSATTSSSSAYKSRR